MSKKAQKFNLLYMATWLNFLIQVILTQVAEQMNHYVVFFSCTYLLPFCMSETMAVHRLSSSSSSGSSTVMRNWGLLPNESR